MYEKKVEDDEGEETTARLPVLRYYNVFNLEQCEGIPTEKVPDNPRDFEPIGEAEAVVQGMPQSPPIQHGATGAWYMPATDTVSMPDAGHFSPPESYYSTLFHELSHASGHQSRLNRQTSTKPHRFGSRDYSQEELVAEMGAAFLCGHCGIEQATVENSAAYIQGWLKKLKGDHRLVVIAAAQAQKAADFIMGAAS